MNYRTYLNTSENNGLRVSVVSLEISPILLPGDFIGGRIFSKLRSITDLELGGSGEGGIGGGFWSIFLRVFLAVRSERSVLVCRKAFWLCKLRLVGEFLKM